MSLILKYWGVRGSLPSSPSPAALAKDAEGLLRGFFKAGYSGSHQIQEYFSSLAIPELGGFGTATTCVEVISEKGGLILDGGSGIRNLGEHVMSRPASERPQHFHIFMTHFHWDHILGLPFFTPLFLPGTKITFYAVQPDLEEVIRAVFKKPFFPVPFEALPSKINFVTLAPRVPIQIDDMKVTPYQLDHPDPCWGYRIESGGRVYAHCVDTEGTRVSVKDLGPDLPLYQGVDLMFFDAQYTLPELAEKANWGHSAAQIGLDIAFREEIKYVIFAHHDPGATIQRIYDIKKQTREYYDWRLDTALDHHHVLPSIQWRFAYEGLEIDLAQISHQR